MLTLGGVERITAGTVVTWRRPLACGLVQTFSGATPTTPQYTRTQLHDHIGSIVAIASDTGNLVENADHGAFGNRRGWVGSTQLGQLNLTTTDRGFTGHEHAQNLDTIHMNGRIYDPVQARFLQADPLVQDPYNPQNWNPFAYVYNNPLANTDPTGMMSQAVRQVIGIVIAALAVITQQYYLLKGAAAFWLAAGAGFASGYVSSGTLKGGLYGAFSAAMFYGIGSTFAGVETLTAGQAGAKMLMHGIAGGIMSELQGGKFGHGFASAAVTQAFSSKIDGIDAGARFSAKRVIAAAALGGTTSFLTGGKFGNGAMTGAFSRAFNAESHNTLRDQAEEMLQADGALQGQLTCESNCHQTAEAAHVAAGNRYLGASILTKREVSWRVYQVADESFAFTYPRVGEAGSHYVKLPSPTGGPGYQSSGHTHWDNQSQFSLTDWRLITQARKTGAGHTLFLAAKNGTLQFSTPAHARSLGIQRGASYGPPVGSFNGTPVDGVTLDTLYKPE